MEKIPYVNFNAQTSKVKKQLVEACSKVLDSGWFILGPEVQEFEKEAASYLQTEFCIGVSNGTDALIQALLAMGIGPGDEVITAPNSFIASASAIHLVGGTPVLADIDEDLNISAKAIENAITKKTKAVMPVHLTGRPCKMDDINAVAKKHNLLVLEDAAQSFGAKLNEKPVGSLGDIAGFSLHPLKNLHAFGDGGLVTTSNSKFYDQILKIRNLGLKDRNTCEFFAGNGRLDEIQAAMLRINLANLDEWTEERRKIAFRFNEELKDLVSVPVEGPGEHCVYQTYVLQADKRDELLDYLQKNGVDAKIHYPFQIHNQPAAAHLGYKDADFPVASKIKQKIISLPLYPGLTEEQQEHIIKSIRTFYAS